MCVEEGFLFGNNFFIKMTDSCGDFTVQIKQNEKKKNSPFTFFKQGKIKVSNKNYFLFIWVRPINNVSTYEREKKSKSPFGVCQMQLTTIELFIR